MSIKDLQPAAVWTNFYALTQIPRPSKNEQKASEFLYEWGLSHGLESHRDEVGNVIIRKPATPGFENLKGVVMQGHMDMVPAKTSDSTHNFDTDPIQTVIDGEWVKTKGTTLGADNGIGVALALAVLQSEDLQHGPLEAVFTVDEEQGMTGARALSPDALNGEILLNLDEEEDGALCVGCAGGVNVTATKSYTPCTDIPAGYHLYTISADKGEGGHSGQDIPLGRINANKSVARILLTLLEKYGALLVGMEGGSLRNAIPITSAAQVLIPEANETEIVKEVVALMKDILDEHHISDPKAEMIFLPSPEKASEYVPAADALQFVRALMACPHGPERMSEVIAGLTETSTNMALVKIGGGEFFVKSLTRSSVDSAKDTLALRQKALFDLIGCNVVMDGAYNGWKPNENSAILKVMKEVYKKLNGKEPIVNATHGGLECGIFSASYPHWDMIAFGPTLCFPHSPAEKLYIPSVGHAFEYLCEVLKNIPEAEAGHHTGHVLPKSY